MRALHRLREAAAAMGLLALLALTLSGWGLMAGYVPSEAEAFDSVVYYRTLAGTGALLRGLHHHAATAAVVAGAVYLLAAFLLDAPRASRRGWWSALALLLLALFACFTGYLLPMDQHAYWGNAVRLGIVESVPLAGASLADALRGGGAPNAATLPRYYALHVGILPFVSLLPLALLLRGLPGSTPPDTLRRGLAWAGLSLLGLYALALLLGAPLEPRADPTDVEYTPRPEWYFLWLFQVGKYTGAAAWLQSTLVPGALAAALVTAPWLPALTAPRRAGVALAGLGAWLALTGAALWEDRDLPPKPSYEEALQARAAEIYDADCRSCHGDEGRGDGSQSRAFGLSPPDMTSAGYWAQADPETMAAAIRDGSGEDMPDFGEKLRDEEIGALVVFLQRFRPQ